MTAEMDGDFEKSAEKNSDPEGISAQPNAAGETKPSDSPEEKSETAHPAASGAPVCLDLALTAQSGASAQKTDDLQAIQKADAIQATQKTEAAETALLTAEQRPEFSAGFASLSIAVWTSSGTSFRRVFPRMESLLVGRGPSAAVRIDDPSVDQIHCLLKAGTDGIWVQNLGGGRTSVGNSPLTAGASVPVKPGTAISIGDARLIVEAAGPASGEASAKMPLTDKPALEARLIWDGTILECLQTAGKSILRLGAGGKKSEIRIPEKLRNFPLAKVGRDKAVIRIPEDVSTVVSGDGKFISKQSDLVLSEGESAEFVFDGHLSLSLRFGKFPKGVQDVSRERPGFFPILGLLIFSAAALIVWNLSVYKVNEAAFVDEFFSNPQKLARWAAYVAPKEKPKIVEPADAVRDEENPEGSTEEDPGSKGDPDKAPGKPGKPGKPGRNSRKKVLSSGLLGALGGLGGGASGSVFSGGGSFSAGIDAALGSVSTGNSSASIAPGIGSGFGLRGASSGAGGLGIGTLGGLGGGGGGDGGEGGEGGGGGGRGGGRKKRTADVRRAVPGKSVIEGSCERDVVGAVISKNARQVLACYEAELLRSPSLSGKVAVCFTIEPDGKVGDVEITESSIGSPGVEACLKRRIQRWRFPQPKGGGVCVVKYPWMFQQAGGETR